ncbi:MAG: phosphatidate cytidylyltransferase [Pseudomonadota bacterium]
MIQRVITGLILAPICIYLVLAVPTSVFGSLFFCVLGIGLYEWRKLAGETNAVFWSLLSVLLIVFVLLMTRFDQSPAIVVAFLGTLFWLIQCFLMARSGLGNQKNPMQSMIEAVIVIGACWVAAVAVHRLDNGPLLTVIMFSVVWSADTFAYFVGKRFGRRKLAPEISPGKTIEGVLGGVFGALVISGSLAYFLLDFRGPALYLWMTATVFSALVSVAGDLYESCLKRHAGQKDSGNILPGHGGVLDRIDGLLAATPVFALFWLVLHPYV